MPPVVTKKLVARWPFNSDANEIVNEIESETIKGYLTPMPDGKIDQAMRFIGRGYVSTKNLTKYLPEYSQAIASPKRNAYVVGLAAKRPETEGRKSAQELARIKPPQRHPECVTAGARKRCFASIKEGAVMASSIRAEHRA